MPRRRRHDRWRAALLAGAGAGYLPHIARAAEACVVLERRFEPDPQRSAAFDARYQLYRRLYPAIAPICHEL
jgi:sugar (pentulose or hexulose) kinase